MISSWADPADPQTAAAGKTTVLVTMNLNSIAGNIRNRIEVCNSELVYSPFKGKPLSVSFYRTRIRSLAMLLTHWLPNSCLVKLIDVILACEDGNSKFAKVDTVADIDD